MTAHPLPAGTPARTPAPTELVVLDMAGTTVRDDGVLPGAHDEAALTAAGADLVLPDVSALGSHVGPPS